MKRFYSLIQSLCSLVPRSVDPSGCGGDQPAPVLALGSGGLGWGWALKHPHLWGLGGGWSGLAGHTKKSTHPPLPYLVEAAQPPAAPFMADTSRPTPGGLGSVKLFYVMV